MSSMSVHQCPLCQKTFSRRDNMLRHQQHAHQERDREEKPDTPTPLLKDSTETTFRHPFTMVVTGPSNSGKSMWTNTLLKSALIQPSPERVVYCYGQWQPLYVDLKRSLHCVEFIEGIPDRLTDPHFIDGSQRVVIVFDDLMTEAKCDQRIADLFTKGSHHRNISVMYLTQNLFPQGKACRDIALNTQYLVLFNNPIDRQQVAALARRIYPTNSIRFVKRFEEAVQKPYGYLVVDLKARTPEHERLKSDIFPEVDRKKQLDAIAYKTMNDECTQGWTSTTKRPFEEDESDHDDIMEDEDDSLSAASGPPGKRRRAELREWFIYEDIWHRRFKDPLRQAHIEQFQASVNGYTDRGYTFNAAVPRAANDELPQLRKMLRRDYAQFLIDFYALQGDLTQQLILQSAKTLRAEHDMSVAESIRQAVKLRKDLFHKIWPDHVIDDDTEVYDQEIESTEDEDISREETT